MKILFVFAALAGLASAEQCKICDKNSKVDLECFENGIKSKWETTKFPHFTVTVTFTVKVESAKENCWIRLTRESDGHTLNVSTDGVPVEHWVIRKTKHQTPKIFLNYQSSFPDTLLGEYSVEFADGISLDFHVVYSNHTRMNGSADSDEDEDVGATSRLSLPSSSPEADRQQTEQLENDGASPATWVIVGLCVVVAGAFFVVALLVRALRTPRTTLPFAKANSSSSSSPPSLFHMDTMKLVSELGRGHFGVVYKAQLKDGRAIWTVAIKRALHAGAEARLRKELEVMASVPFHVNLVNLQGVARDKDRLCLVLEFCHLGSLIDYLKANRLFLSDRLRTEGSANSVRQPISQTFIGLAQQISNGMWFLSSRCHVVHGDLAARNILLLSDNMKNVTAKISDFGLAQVESDSNECKGLLGADDVEKVSFMAAKRWAAPEALRDRKASAYSDIWSFGITFWEMFSLGAMPYEEYEDSEVIENVERGLLRPSRPSGCPTNVFQVMETCWAIKPTERPTFHQLLVSLTDLLEDKKGYHCNRELANKQMLHTYMNVSENLVCNSAYRMNETGQAESAGYLKMTGSSFRSGQRRELSSQKDNVTKSI